MQQQKKNAHNLKRKQFISIDLFSSTLTLQFHIKARLSCPQLLEKEKEQIFQKSMGLTQTLKSRF